MTDNFEKDINVPSKGFIVMENEFAESPVEAYETLKEQLIRKEQECEELKYELVLKDVANIELSDEVKKYRKAIDEIEEIADNNYEIAEMEQIFLIIGGLDV